MVLVKVGSLGGWQGGVQIGLPNLYKKKLQPLDTRFHGTLPGQSGPLVRRLESFGRVKGLVVGPWGECSKDMHSLIKVMGETKVAAQARDRGRPASDNELGVVMAQIRKYLSTAFVRAQGLCLINRLCFLGEGARAAAGRRDLAKRLEGLQEEKPYGSLPGSHTRPGPGKSGSDFCALSDKLKQYQ